MDREKRSAPGLEVGRASVHEHRRIISQEEWERGCDAVALAFCIMAALYAVWTALA